MTQESTTNQQTMTPKFESAPSYRDEATDDKNLFRVVDRENEWSHYKLKAGDKETFMPSVNHILGIGFPKGQGLLNWLKTKTAEESDKILKHAGERGSRTHVAIRDLIQGQTLSAQAYYKNEDGSSTPLQMDEWDFLLSWAAWCEVYKPQMLKHETAVYHPKYKYAGTVDFIGTITIPALQPVNVNGKMMKFGEPVTVSCLLDWKTSGGIYDEYKLQTAAYAACMKLKPKQAFYTGVIRLGTKHKNGGFEMQLWDRNQTLINFKQFLKSKDTYHFINGTDWKPDIEQIPLVLKVDVPQIKPNGPKQNKPRNEKPDKPGAQVRVRKVPSGGHRSGNADKVHNEPVQKA